MSKRNTEFQLIASIQSNNQLTKETIIRAQEIQFVNTPTCVVNHDSFGFVKREVKKVKPRERFIKKESRQADETLFQWLNILNDFNQYKQKNYDRLKLKTRKGIPDCLRSEIWLLLADIDQMKDGNDDTYNELLNDHKLTIDEPETKDELMIIRDITKTFPLNVLYMNILSKGQCELYNVLIVYSKYNLYTGYVSGMNYLAGLFLTYMNEESSFWLLHYCMMEFNLRDYFTKDYSELKKSLYVLLSLIKAHMPKLYMHLKEKKVKAMMYASGWFFTFFSSVLKFNIVVRILDVLLFEGIKVLYRISLGLFKLKQKALLLCTQVEDLLLILKNIGVGINEDVLFKCSFTISLSRKEIMLYEQQYEVNKDDSQDEIISQIGL